MTEPDPREVAALDRELDRVREARLRDDPALAALAEAVKAIDARAIGVAHQRPVNGTPRPTVRPLTPRHRDRPPRNPRRRMRKALLALPMAVVLALVIVGPLGASPHSPLYPFHRTIFEHGKPSPVEVARQSLASAKQALDQAGTATPSARATSLENARKHLKEARKQLAQVTDPATRAELDAEIDNLERRAHDLDEGQKNQQGDDNGDSSGSGNHNDPGDADQGNGEGSGSGNGASNGGTNR
jgi:hypothetical protein